MGTNNNYPYKITDFDPEETAEIFKYFNEGLQDGYLRIGPKGYCFSFGFKDDAPKIYNMPLRSDDVFVVTFPKAGTTWAQELVWMVANDLDYEKSAATPLPMRFPFLEMSFLLNSEKSRKWLREQTQGDERLQAMVAMLATPGSVMTAAMPSPRFIKSHLPLSLLPPSLLDTTKVVYVARDPRDVAVSYYHHNKFFKIMGYTGDFKTYWNFFVKSKLDWTPFFPHVLEAWEQRNHPNMLFIFYEDMLKDLPASVRRVAKFIGKEITEEQVAKLCDHLSFSNFKKNKSVNFEFLKELSVIDENRSFVRKGKAGDWRDYFDDKMAAEAEQWIEDNLRGTDLRFPHYDKK